MSWQNELNRRGRRAMKYLQNLSDMDSDDVLAAIGLQRRSTAWEDFWPAASFFAAGALIGVGLGLFFAPKPGEQLREDMARRFERTRAKMREGAEQMVEQTRQ